ncbi:sodium/potassium/calcium exchanger 1 [Dasypus novemcinctus]|uniref:sodium/potassium/calcium exchanger 1 n=1 Tax=Dasypus novemcinctus TaxID=9361 RepID=UPI00265F6596|nr:sodium/potassium/calcium exchanger 1 [Dasypus novemcinctus]
MRKLMMRMRAQERWFLRPKRLHWSRFLFLLGMLLISSTYQHLRSPQFFPSPWAAVSSQHPVKLTSWDLPSDEMAMMSSDPPKASSKIEGKMLVPQAIVGRDEVTPSIAMENTPSPPRRTANITPAAPKNNHSPTAAAGTERIKETSPTTPRRGWNHNTQTSGRQTVNNYTPTTPRREKENYHPTQARGKVKKHAPSPPGRIVEKYAPSTLMTLKTSHVITLRTTVQDSEVMATHKRMETSPPKRIVEEKTPTALKGLADNTPTSLTNKVEMNILTSPRSIVKKNTLTPLRRVENNISTNPWRSVGRHRVTPPQGTGLEHTSAISEEQVMLSTRITSSPAETSTHTAAWSGRKPLLRTSAPLSSVVFRGLAKKASTAPSTSATARFRANTTTQVHHCVVMEPAPSMPTAPFPSLTTALLPEPSRPSPSGLPSSHPDLHPKAEYPPDLFTMEERRQGWVVLHVFGMMYVFVALAIVCDEYFVPSLDVITDKLQISEDVAGATFMAAGGSAPELFTSLIGVFISHSNVGIGTIVGSAVFNILFVIGTCALCSREILNLTWWPLFRDISFYIFDLLMLILFFLDSLIAWWESLLLLLAYALYVLTMKWNKQFELWVKEQLSRRPVAKVMALGDLSKEDVAGTESKREMTGEEVEAFGEGETREQGRGETQPECESEIEAEGKKDECESEGEIQAKERENESESEGEGEIEAGDNECEVQLKGDREGESEIQTKGDNDSEGEGEVQAGDNEYEGGIQADGEDGEMKGDEGETEGQEFNDDYQGEAKSSEKGADGEEGGDGGDSEDEEEEEEEEEVEDVEEEEEENEEPLSLEWPETRQQQTIYLFLLPITFPLWLTVPDVRRLASRKFFVITFLGSIVWIAMFSYLMVWWAHQVGETIGISEEIMGLTILAAGTSIPDLITSVIVARKGLGDMAVSSSVGSNIFDITVGLPLPWLLFSLINGLQPVPVSSNGLFCAIVLLFLMLLFVISSIASCKWRMNKMLGFTMFLLYFVFLIISVMLEARIIFCPVSV